MASTSKDALYRKGQQVRQQVLGAKYVKSRAQSSNEYTAAFDEFSTSAAWGMIWSRPGLSRKSRSLLNLGMLTALGQQQELRLHIRGALRNGLTRKEVAEALLQATVYCGIPRAADARRTMVEVFEALDAEAAAVTPARRRARA